MNWLSWLPDLYQLQCLMIVCLMALLLLLCLRKLQRPLEAPGGMPGEMARAWSPGRLFRHPLGLLLLALLATLFLFTLGLLTMLRLRQNGLWPSPLASDGPGESGLGGWRGAWAGVFLLLMLWATGLWLARRPAPATPLVMSGILLTLWGLFLLARLGLAAVRNGQAAVPSSPVFRQAGAAILGLGALLLAGSSAGRVLGRIARDYRTLLYLTLTALLLAVATGISGAGAPRERLELKLGSLGLHPAEWVQVIFVTGLAASLTRLAAVQRSRRALTRELLPPALLLLTIATMALHHDYGAALLLALILIALVWCCPPFRWWSLGIGAALIVTLLLCLYLHRPRPLYEQFGIWRYPFSRNEQAVQALWGIAEGGWCGAGPGRGAIGQLPAAPSNLIAALVAEEFGLGGVGVLLLAYATLTLGGFALAARTTDKFGSLLATGLTFLLVCQALLSLAGAANLMPFAGMPLPFVSRSVSALVTAYLVLGLIIACSEERGPLAADHPPHHAESRAPQAMLQR